VLLREAVKDENSSGVIATCFMDSFLRLMIARVE